MGGSGVIDNFLGVFTSYIDSGFGLLDGEVAFIATTLIVIDVTLAALFWSWGARAGSRRRVSMQQGRCSNPSQT